MLLKELRKNKAPFLTGIKNVTGALDIVMIPNLEVVQLTL
jgi:hypothetical protein